MTLSTLDWSIIVAFLGLSLLIGLLAARRSGEDSSAYFLSGRHMPWWLLGFSMVATTFSTDTPNLVTNMTRVGGVAGNWEWWVMLLSGMLTVFVYAKLWRRSRLMTDVQFYELRYSGKPAAFLRCFRAAYMSFVFGVIQLAAVTLGAIKIFGVLIGMTPWQVIVIIGGVTAIYSCVGGLRGVIWTDFFQFAVAMAGSVAAAVVAVNHPQVGGLRALLAHPAVAPRMSVLPDFSNPDLVITIFVLPLAVYWWAMWYPGSEPGGGAYVAQRILAARNERHAMGATLFFQFAHYALRPWPWILVALASLVVFPDLEAMGQYVRERFPAMEGRVGHDMAYPAMLTFLPSGLMGIVVASLIAAYMSTASTHLNLMSAYAVNDFYKRFVDPTAPERRLVLLGRVMTFIFLGLASLVALALESALDSFKIVLQIGAGTGLVFLLRWFWWRVSAYSEIAAMATSLASAVFFKFAYPAIARSAGWREMAGWETLLAGIVATTVVWLTVTLLTPPTSDERLRAFYRAVRPGGRGWSAVRRRAEADGEPIPAARFDVPLALLCVVLGCAAVYSMLFSIGEWIYGRPVAALLLTILSAGCAVAILVLWPKLNTEAEDGTDAAMEPALVGKE